MGNNPEFKQKSILAVHDLSCYGTASLGVAIPVLTAFGYEVVALPSVILSSTTDIDQDPVALETTGWMRKTVDRWKERQLTFDAIYTGWLGDPKQIDLLIEICEGSIHDRTTVLVDPVLGDGGELYPCQEELAKDMSRLFKRTHIITPNPTEATLLLNKQPQEYGIKTDGTISAELAGDLVTDLAITFPGTLPIVKSVVEEENIGVCVRFTPDNTNIREPITETILAKRAGSSLVGGTGDLFASLVIGKWVQQGLDRQSGKEEKSTIIKSSIETISVLMELAQRNKMHVLPFRNLLSVNQGGI